MIRCYYREEILKYVAKWGRLRVVFNGCFLIFLGWLPLIGMSVMCPDPLIYIASVVGIVSFSGFFYLHHWLNLNVERRALRSAGDTITLDDEEIRLVKEDGSQITLPRKDLKINSPYYAGGSRMFKIWNPLSDSNHEIVLTSVMENAKQLVNTIEPGLWEQLDREDKTQG